MQKACFILTGKLSEDVVLQLLQVYEEAPHKILSTWADEPAHLLIQFQLKGFTIVLNEYPKIRTSANLQATCIANGCRRAQELGLDFCIRMRTDMIPYNLAHFTNIMVALRQDKLLCLSGMSSQNPKLWYYLDVLVAGNTETLLHFFTPQQPDQDLRCAEMFWLESYLGHLPSTKEDVTSAFSFCGPYLLAQPVFCEWHGKGWELFQHYIRPTNDFIWYK